MVRGFKLVLSTLSVFFLFSVMSLQKPALACPNKGHDHQKEKHHGKHHCHRDRGSPHNCPTCPPCGDEQLNFDYELSGLKECMQGMKNPTIRIISGQAKSVTVIPPTDEMVLIMLGNDTVTNVVVDPADQFEVARACVFVAGDRPVINMDFGLPLESLAYMVRGNQSQATISINAPGSVKNIKLDLDNQSQVTISGTGTHSCAGIVIVGDSSGVTCR